MNEVKNKVSGSSPVRPLNSTPRRVAPVQNNVRYFEPARAANSNFVDPSQLSRSEGGFNFTGIDSFGEIVRGFVQTPEAALAAKELERAGIKVQTISERKKGAREKPPPDPD